MKYQDILPIILDFEGGYANHPNDPGGPTNRGVTQRVYDEYRTAQGSSTRDVREITYTEVEQIYSKYWVASACDEFVDTHPRTALLHFDFAVNAGPGQANKVLQRAVGAQPVDGVIGNVSLRAINSRSDQYIFDIYVVLRNNFYWHLVDKRKELYPFLRGWLRRVEKIKESAYVRNWVPANTKAGTNSTRPV